MEKKITQNDVAREAGVTRSMVSYVISGSSERSVAPETRARILEVIERLGYRPNKAAQALQQGNESFAKNQIGVVLCSAGVFLRPYYAEILAGIHTAAHEHGYHVRFSRFFSELKNPVLFNELIHPEEIGGLILDEESDWAVIERTRERIARIVCVEWTYEGLSSIGFDRQNAARKAARHLLDKHYFPLGYIGESDDRIAGVQQALADCGRDVSSLACRLPAGDMAGGYAAVRQLHEAGSLPRGVVCGSDEVAIGVLHYLNEHHIAVPGEVALISMDNIESAAYTCPPLSSMNVQKSAMGARAVDMLVGGQELQGDSAMNVSLPTTLVERESC